MATGLRVVYYAHGEECTWCNTTMKIGYCCGWHFHEMLGKLLEFIFVIPIVNDTKETLIHSKQGYRNFYNIWSASAVSQAITYVRDVEDYSGKDDNRIHLFKYLRRRCYHPLQNNNNHTPPAFCCGNAPTAAASSTNLVQGFSTHTSSFSFKLKCWPVRVFKMSTFNSTLW